VDESQFKTEATVAITRATDAAVASSAALHVALAADAGKHAAHAYAIAVSELATNVFRHGGGGEIQLGSAPGRLWVRALDRGPGIQDAQAALVDRWSQGQMREAGVPPAGGLGCGLGAVLRLMDGLTLTPRDGGGLQATAWKSLLPRPAR